jgi:predicted Zn-dependent protease with MMP-like domain
MLSFLFALAISRPRRPALARKPANAGCQLCQSIGSHFETQFFRGNEGESLHAQANQVCKQLDDPLCSEFVTNSFDDLKTAILTGATVADACGQVGYCQPAKKARVASVKKPKDELTCQFCENLVSYIEHLLLDGYTKPEIEQLVKEMCNQLPSVLGVICNDVIDQALDNIIDWLEQDIDAFNICVKIDLCSGDEKKKRVARRTPRNLYCDLCREFVTYVEDLVLKNYTEGKIEALVKEMCDQLPHPLSQLCSDCIDQVIDDVINWIIQGIDDYDICANLGFCTQGGQARRPVTRKAPADLYCDMCRDYIAYIEDLVLKNYTEGEIETLVKEMCDQLPHPLSQICNDCIDQVIDDVIDWIIQGIDNFGICVKLGFCSGTRRRKVRQIASR